MAQGVAKVQNLPPALLPLVLGHHRSLDFHIAANYFIYVFSHVGFHQKMEKALVGDETVLESLRRPVQEGVLRQGGEGIRIADHGLGLPEGPHQVLAGRQVHGGFAPHGGVGGRQESGGHLNKVDAPLVGGGGEARKVPHHAAAQSHHAVAAGNAALCQKAQDLAIGGERLLLLPGGNDV